MSDAELCNQGIDRTHLHAGLATGIPEICGRDMVFSIRLNQSQKGETFDNLYSRFRSSESLKEFLQNQASEPASASLSTSTSGSEAAVKPTIEPQCRLQLWSYDDAIQFVRCFCDAHSGKAKDGLNNRS